MRQADPAYCQRGARFSIKAIAASRDKERTDEVAVMVDSFHPLRATAAAGRLENPNYWASWK